MKTYARITCLIVIVMSLAFVASPIHAKSNFGKGASLGTASVGGTFYVWGGAWAKMVSNDIDYKVGVETTGGPVHNIKLVNTGGTKFGLCSMPAAYDGYKGLRWANGKKHKNIRALFPMYPSYATIWTLAKYDIENVRDINGRVVNLAPKGGTPDTYYRIMFDILGIKPKKIVNSGFSDLVGQLKDEMIEVGAGTGGSPFGPAMETEATHKINLVKFSKKDREKILSELPSWFEGSIKKEDFDCLEEDHPTLQYWNILIANKDIPDDLAYTLTKHFYENIDEFQDTYKPTTKTKPEDITRSVIPVHPGAKKYYNEVGVDISDN